MERLECSSKHSTLSLSIASRTSVIFWPFDRFFLVSLPPVLTPASAPAAPTAANTAAYTD